jgi:hypothetical protein
MELLDIAVASGYAAICLTLIVMMNPVAPREVAVDAASQSSLDSATLAYVEAVGLPFLATSSPSAVCGSAAAASNATVAFAVVQGADCDTVPPTSSLATSSLTLDLPGRTLVIEAWLVRQ